MEPFDYVKIFRASMKREQDTMDADINKWLLALSKAGGEVVDMIVKQSSDSEYHCITIVFTYVVGDGAAGPVSAEASYGH